MWQIYSPLGDGPLGYLWEILLIPLVDVGQSSLWVGGPLPGQGILNYISGEKEAGSI